MSHYWKRCPYCGHTVEDGHGFPTKRLGDPKRQCIYCSNTYMDRSVIAWERASAFKKLQYYYANGRFFLCFIPYVIASSRVGLRVEWDDWQVYLACSPIFLIASVLCVIYVRHQVKDYLYIYVDERENGASDRHYEKYQDGLFSIHQTKNSKKRRR